MVVRWNAQNLSVSSQQATSQTLDACCIILEVSASLSHFSGHQSVSLTTNTCWVILQCFAENQELMLSFDDVHFVVLARFVPCWLGAVGCLVLRRLSETALTRRPKHLLRSIGDVEEAVCVPVAGINVSHAGRHARHALLCHQEEETFGGVQINLVPDSKRCRRWSETSLSQPSQMAANHLPEQTQELTQGELKGNQELCLVQQGEGLFADVAFNNYLKTKTRWLLSKLTAVHLQHWAATHRQFVGEFRANDAHFIFSCF